MIKEMYKNLGIDENVYNFTKNIENELKDRFAKIDEVAEYNQLKVMKAFQKNQVSEAHLGVSTGYGYNDIGRDTLEKVYADVFGTEDALVRPQITCGTHALGIALSANLRPGDKILYISGKPYDTLEEVIGIRESKGSLAEYGIKYGQVDLLPNGDFDFDGIKKAITSDVKMVGIQRSKGYETRPTISVEKTGQVINFVKEINKDIKVKKINEKITKDNINILFEDNYDYIIDACDTVIVKKLLIKLCKEKNINFLTVCGMGKKLDITKIKICDIKDTSYDPIAKSLRKYIKDEKIRGKVMCVFSSEKPNNTNKEVIASMMPVPSVAGIYAANYILQDIIKK